MTIKERMQSPAHTFFKKVQNIGLILASIGATVARAVSQSTYEPQTTTGNGQ